MLQCFCARTPSCVAGFVVALNGISMYAIHTACKNNE